jgi:hypothetical protein
MPLGCEFRTSGLLAELLEYALATMCQINGNGAKQLLQRADRVSLNRQDRLEKGAPCSLGGIFAPYNLRK